MATGGEISGSAVFTAESLSKQRRGLVIGTLLGGITLGTPLAALLIYGLSTNISHTNMLSYGWRIPFFAGVLLGLLGGWLRISFVETPAFQNLQKTHTTLSFPLKTVLQKEYSRILLGIGLMCLTAGGGFTLYYLPLYLHNKLDFKLSEVFLLNVYNFTLLATLTGFFGWLSDFIARRKLLVIGSILTPLAAIALSIALPTKKLETIVLASIFFSIAFSLVNSTSFVLLIDLFPTNTRCSGMSLAYNVGFGVLVGIAPFVTMVLLNTTGHFIGVLYYLFILTPVRSYGSLGFSEKLI